ncbi:hypothetical protein GCM10025331_79470 [Actinoplanes utahensis]|nr:hypothetical protein Aut01nite_82300 [Actinoplanes utahensis]
MQRNPHTRQEAAGREVSGQQEIIEMNPTIPLPGVEPDGSLRLHAAHTEPQRTDPHQGLEHPRGVPRGSMH